MARRRLPHFLFEYIDGGSFAEQTLERNVSDLSAIALRQRVLRDVSSIDLSAQMLGRRFEMPVALAPVGLAGLNARRGEVQTARAAGAAGIPFCLSTVSVCSIGEVRAGVDEPFWFQLYVLRDRGFMKLLMEQAAEAGCSALVFTVDMPIPGTRYRDFRSGLAGAPSVGGQLRRFGHAMICPHWSWDVGVHGRPHTLGNVAPILGDKTGIEDFFAWMRGNFDPSIAWKDLAWIRNTWKGPLIIKGILEAEDACAAADLGADAIVVSNHGGRQLDSALSSACALRPIADAVGERLIVLADGGVHSGLDVVKLLALGAKGVLIGRAWAFALAAEGGLGVARMLETMRSEMCVAMALTGCTRLADIGPAIVADTRARGFY